MTDWGHDSTDSLVERVRPLLNSIHMGNHDQLCRVYSGFPEHVAKGCNCTLAEAGDALAALTELAERLKAAEASHEKTAELFAWNHEKAVTEIDKLRAQRDEALDREAGTSDALDEMRAQRDEALAAAEQVPQLVEAAHAVCLTGGMAEIDDLRAALDKVRG